MSKPRTLDSIERTAKAVREESAKSGRPITQEQAKDIVRGSIQRHENRHQK